MAQERVLDRGGSLPGALGRGIFYTEQRGQGASCVGALDKITRVLDRVAPSGGFGYLSASGAS